LQSGKLPTTDDLTIGLPRIKLSRKSLCCHLFVAKSPTLPVRIAGHQMRQKALEPLDTHTLRPTFEPLDLSKSQIFNGPQGIIPGFKPLSPKQSINTIEPPRLLSRIVATTLQLAAKATPHVETSTNPAAPAASSSHTFVANPPQAIIDSAKKLNSSPKFSTNPLAKIPEETVSREWYIDNLVKK
jgi:hypothetical protein